MLSSSIKIGSRLYSVGIIDDESLDVFLSQKYQTEDVEIKSLIDYDDQIILVKNSLGALRKEELVVHEILHACLEDSGYDQSEASENIITCMAPRLASIIRSQLPALLHDIFGV